MTNVFKYKLTNLPALFAISQTRLPGSGRGGGSSTVKYRMDHVEISESFSSSTEDEDMEEDDDDEEGLHCCDNFNPEQGYSKLCF